VRSLDLFQFGFHSTFTQGHGEALHGLSLPYVLLRRVHTGYGHMFALRWAFLVLALLYPVSWFVASLAYVSFGGCTALFGLGNGHGEIEWLAGMKSPESG